MAYKNTLKVSGKQKLCNQFTDNYILKLNFKSKFKINYI